MGSGATKRLVPCSKKVLKEKERGGDWEYSPQGQADTESGYSETAR
jgi:hypothetical protein